MSRDPWVTQLSHLQGVITAWSASTDEQSSSSAYSQDEASQIRDQFLLMGSGNPGNALKSYGVHGDKSEWFPIKGFFPALPVVVRQRTEDDQTLWPLVALQLRVVQGQLEMMARVAVFFADDAGIVDAFGWRFDSADSDGDGLGPNFHHYCHVQHISSWEIGEKVLLPPGTVGRPEAAQQDYIERRISMPETRPAFPLACKSPAGLLAAAMLSIYGARLTAKLLVDVRGVQSEMKLVMNRELSDFLA